MFEKSDSIATRTAERVAKASAIIGEEIRGSVADSRRITVPWGFMKTQPNPILLSNLRDASVRQVVRFETGGGAGDGLMGKGTLSFLPLFGSNNGQKEALLCLDLFVAEN
ncbi:unnamed protein product [Arabidopsis lyrata]|nr:unnamed protein product [Arabidopsis lyrata]